MANGRIVTFSTTSKPQKPKPTKMTMADVKSNEDEWDALIRILKIKS
jgi:hypothetical protein